jgi:hypothetical protein
MVLPDGMKVKPCCMLYRSYISHCSFPKTNDSYLYLHGFTFSFSASTKLTKYHTDNKHSHRHQLPWLATSILVYIHLTDYDHIHLHAFGFTHCCSQISIPNPILFDYDKTTSLDKQPFGYNKNPWTQSPIFNSG